MPIVQTSLKSKNYNALGIDEIADDIENIITEVNILSAGGGSGTTTTVDISSAQILAMGTSPIELLPVSGVNAYYDIESIILEYTHVTTPYNLGVADVLKITDDGSYILEYYVYSDFITQTENRVSIIKGDRPFDIIGNYQLQVGHAGLNLGLILTLYDNDGFTNINPTLGDGTLRAIITYTVRTFGA